MREIKVLDKGYVRLIKYMGDDLDVVNGARASYHRESSELTERDIRLLRRLSYREHTSPFRHSWATFEIKAPLFVARQWWRHVVGSAALEEGSNWSEMSRRYVIEEPDYYFPTEWRSKPKDRNHGRGLPISPEGSAYLTERLREICQRATSLYLEAVIGHGVAPEMARFFLPVNVYTTWRWTASIHAILHFLSLRGAEDAQEEIRQYAEAVRELVLPIWPNAIRHWEKANRIRRLAIEAVLRGVLSVEDLERLIQDAEGGDR